MKNKTLKELVREIRGAVYEIQEHTDQLYDYYDGEEDEEQRAASNHLEEASNYYEKAMEELMNRVELMEGN